MAVTGYKSPGTCTSEDRDGKAAWSNPSYASASEDDRAISDVGASTYSDWLRCVNFGFTTGDIPEGATITGIELSIERQAETAVNTYDSAIYLRTSAGQGTSDNKAVADLWPTADASATYGGDADTWNTGYDDSDIRDSTFGVDISIANNHGTQAREARIDHVQIRVYYTVAGADALPMAMNHYRRMRS